MSSMEHEPITGMRQAKTQAGFRDKVPVHRVRGKALCPLKLKACYLFYFQRRAKFGHCGGISWYFSEWFSRATSGHFFH